MIKKFYIVGLALGAMALLLAGVIPSAVAGEPVSKGNFVGKSGHKVSGSLSVVKTDKGYEIQFGSNFSIDSAPGPYVGFGNNGKYDKSTEFSKLKKRKGLQTYSVPASIDATKFNEVYVWCKPFNVPLGVAKLK